MMKKTVIFFITLAFTVACSQRVVKPTAASYPDNKTIKTVEALPENLPPIQLPPGNLPKVPPSLENNVAGDKPVPDAIPPQYPYLQASQWQALPGFMQDNVLEAWPAWLKSCSVLINRAPWKSVCELALALQPLTNASIMDYFTSNFNVYSANKEDGSDAGLITGYYQPILKGSRQKSAKYPYPLYRRPDNLITVELADIYPELKYKRVRGKLLDNKIVPYDTRAEIDIQPSPLAGHEIFWINDVIDVFFLQIQGSGLVQFENGEQVQVGYADQNGRAYNSIGRVLIDRGELTVDQASMQGIKNWARQHLGELRDLLNSNPSYVFFKELPAGLPGPIGALGVPITDSRSLAIDRQFIPLGAPLFLATTQPNTDTPLNRFMLAQDTGGAIKGGVRADFYWGAGNAAGEKAGAMKQVGKIWVLLPKGLKPN